MTGDCRRRRTDWCENPATVSTPAREGLQKPLFTFGLSAIFVSHQILQRRTTVYPEDRHSLALLAISGSIPNSE